MKISYRFQVQELLQQALTHKSAGGIHSNNERLEFLGDALINFLVSQELFRRFPQVDEGQLSRLRAQVVRQESLAAIARQLQLGEQLILGGGEMKSGGHRRDSILADALEAVIAAIYLDSQELAVCRETVMPWFATALDQLSPEAEYRDDKTRLQEWLQARQQARPMYEILQEQGADNDRTYTVRCRLEGNEQAFIGNGSSKKQAEQLAAAAALQWLQHTRRQVP